MNPAPRSLEIKSAQTCRFLWTVTNVLEKPMVKFSPIFETVIGEDKEQVQLGLNHNYNFIQIHIKPVNRRLDLFQLVTHISNASLIIRYGDNQSKLFDKIPVRATADRIIFKVSRIHFSTVTNDFQDPFDVEVKVDLQPASSSSGVSLLALPSPSPCEPSDDQIHICWQISDVNRLPLVKRSLLFTFNVCGTKHQIQLSMEINNSRIQLRMSSFIMHVKLFAVGLDQISLVLQPADNRPPIEQNIQVHKVIKELIYLTTINTSFADLTANHKTPLTLKMLFGFRETMKAIDCGAADFNWHTSTTHFLYMEVGRFANTPFHENLTLVQVFVAR